MATVTQATPAGSDGQRFLLQGVSWEAYDELLKLLGDQPVRLTFDRGSLELMSPSYRHENSSRLLGRFVEVLTEEFDLDMSSAGSTTFRRQDLDRGLEADEGFYIASEPLIRGKSEIDLDTDPPPDLTIEADITRSSLDRMSIYAALKVPEVWRYDGSSLTVHHLGADGRYHCADRSLSFPKLPVGELTRFLDLRTTQSETMIIKAFRAWVRGL